VLQVVNAISAREDNFQPESSIISWITKILLTFHDPDSCSSHQSGHV